MVVKGIVFDLGGTLMYLDGEWESVNPIPKYSNSYWENGIWSQGKQ